MRIAERTYRCSTCDLEVPVAGTERPVEMLAGSSGRPNEWIVTVGRIEVHRCTFTSPPDPVLIRLTV